MKKSLPKEPKLALASNSASPSQLANLSKTGSPNQSIPLSSGSEISKTTGVVVVANTPRGTRPPRIFNGGQLRTGNPGNKGGGDTPDQLRGTIRQIIKEHGLPFLKTALSATGTVTCPHCDGEVEVPADPKLMAKLLDTGLRTTVGSPVQVEHQAVIVVRDADSLSV